MSFATGTERQMIAKAENVFEKKTKMLNIRWNFKEKCDIINMQNKKGGKNYVE